MALSNELLTQFVKSTKTKNTKTKKETFVRGKLERSNNQWYVRIDGSTGLTPVSITSNVDTTKEVTVMIKNRTATVIGNVSAGITEDDQVLNPTHTSVSFIEESVITDLWKVYNDNKNK